MLAVRHGILVPGSILGVEAVEVGGGGLVGWLAPAPSYPAGSGSIRHYCGPASLRRCGLNGAPIVSCKRAA